MTTLSAKVRFILYTSINTTGKTLADAPLTIGTITPAGGQIKWDAETTTVVAANTSYGWTYTPTDTDNYNKLTGSIVLYRVSTGGGGVSTYAITAADAENGTVSVSSKNASSGKTVTITVKPDEDYELDSIKVTDKNGDKVKLTEKNGKYTFTMPASKVTVKAVFAEIEQSNPFTDVKESDYFYDAVLWAAKTEITGGTSATTFSPDATCTRAQAVTFLHRAEDAPAAETASSFTDVAADTNYTDAVAWAVENGVTGGTGNNQFSPNADCTRAQIVTFLYRYVGK